MMIFVGFVALVSLLCWLLVYAPQRWPLKAAVTVATLAFSFAVWQSLGSYQGWPAPVGLPKHAVFVHGIVVEPDGGKGTIYVWLIPTKRDHSVFGYHNKFNEPRAYKLPYDEATAQAIQRAEQLKAHGATVGFDKPGHKKVPHGHGHGPRIPRSAVRVYALPTPQAPRKGGQQ